jgi:predicted GH43/DUF377 family glycosyl hydrolase
MKWRTLGLLYVPDGRQAWARTHAMLPTPLMVSPEVVRIYLAHLDERSVGRIGYVDVALSDPTRPIAVSQEPILDIGEPGTFDDNGVVPSCVVRTDDRLLLYYYGFQLQNKIPYTIFAGLAASDTIEGPFRRLSRTPLLERTDAELYLRSAPFVLREEERWRMWYVAGNKWLTSNGKQLPLYALHHLVSDDPGRWPDAGAACLTPTAPGEIGFGRPYVLRDRQGYRMWYSIRGRDSYRVGYAVSPDGLRWTRRDDEAGIAASESGWDSEMICFAAVVPAKDRWVMFYNGNGYGRTGVGVAVTDPE